MNQNNQQYTQFQPYSNINNISSNFQRPYQRSISTNKLYQNNIYGPSNNNYFHKIKENKYNLYSRFKPQQYKIEKPIHSYKKRFDKYDRCNYYYNNSNTSLKKSPYYNFTEVKQGQFSYTPIEKNDNNNSQIIYRNVPIYQQKAIAFDIKPLYSSINYEQNNRIYSAYDRYARPNCYYNDVNRSMDCYSQYFSSSLPAIPMKKYYDGYTSNMKSEYKDNYVWSGRYT